MASSFYEQIGQLLEPDWNYYFGSDNNVPINKPFVTDNPAKVVIREYFNKGGKEWITEAFDLDGFDVHRADHTVAVFFLGYYCLRTRTFATRHFLTAR
jgi:hypothetical protein